MTNLPPRRPAPKIGLTGLEWKLTLVSLLSLAYAFSLVAVARPNEVASAAPLQSSSAPTAPATTPVAIADAPSVRPPVRLIASAVTQPRIRTRSS
ncbi:MAG: hypothetical protein IT307_18585 [Chloroflexi bacterium]|nr:hypothetical protein [Chloroflexota bacterium]